VKSAGSLASYFELLRLKGQYDAPRMLWGGRGAGTFLSGVIWVAGRSCWAGLLCAAIIAVLEFVHWVFFEPPERKVEFYQTHRVQLVALTLWVGPMLVFDILMYVAMPGHVLNFFPALAILASLGLAGFSERVAPSSTRKWPWGLALILALVTTTNAVVFVASPHWTAPLLMGLPLTGQEIREHDAGMAGCFRALRLNWPSRSVVLCHCGENFYWGFRQFEYHLPEYKNVLLTSDASLPDPLAMKKWVGYQRRTTFQDKIEITPGEQVLLVVPLNESVDIFKSFYDTRKAILVEDGAVKLYVLHF
jgi:hypothetical protein